MLDHKPDLILADILMPVMDGFSLCRALQSESRTRAIPFLFLSAKKAPEDKIEGMALGAHKYLTKPCSKDELLRAVDLRLKQSEESQKLLSQRAKHVSGTLDRVSLYSLFELFYVGKWTGTIEMDQEDKRGVVRFKEGILEGAEVGDKSADEALRTLLRWTSGTFKAERE
jgi:DNA-binding response OmpR family regulator